MGVFKIGVIVLGILLLFACGDKKEKGTFRYFRNYQRTFNDLNDKHLSAAKQWGIQPLVSDEDFDKQRRKLSKITSCRYYEVDELTHSLPFLVPRAEELLETIGRNFRDSLDAKDLSDCKIQE